MTETTKHTQSELENIFANDFHTPYFIELTQLYFDSKDFTRAIKVCEIGLKSHVKNLEARYMLAKIYLLDNQIQKSEQFLSASLSQDLISSKMLKLFIEVRDSLNRSIHETKKIVDILLETHSDDAFAHRWIHQYNVLQQSKVNIKPKNALTFKMNQNIISFTFYNVLKKQKYYNQAEVVLSMLESSNQINSQIYKKESKQLSQLLNS